MLRRHALSLIAAALLGVCNPAAAQLQPAPPLPQSVLDALRAAAIPEDAVSALVLRGDKTVL
jgi:serine-type D-Ala-D-Ala carboxypeptidase/endopeptidase (penicillin-binding protein 4)